MPKDLRAEVLIPSTAPSRIFQLLTEASHLRCWLAAEAECDVAAGVFSFWGRATPGTPDAAARAVRLLSCSPPVGGGSGAELSFAWTLRGNETAVQITLAAEEGATRLSLTHRNLAERAGSVGSIHDFWIVALENLRLYTATGRAQALLAYGPKPAPAISLSVEVHGSVEEVFSYLIQPERVGMLWGDEQVVIEPRVGGVYDYGWKDGGPRRILALDPPRLLSFSWLYPPETAETVVTWRLEENDGITRLTLEHSGFTPEYDDEEYRAGWFSFLAIIKGLVELGGAWTRVSVEGVPHGEV